jgi:uncharacterized protein YukE
LQDALNQLAGDADQIAAYSNTWKNVGVAVQKAAKDLADTVNKDTANWTGEAADTYRANIKNKIDHINAAATCANTIGTVVQIVGVITGAVRGLVRDMVTQAVGDFIQDALEEVCSLGLGTPVVVAQVVEQVRLDREDRRGHQEAHQLGRGAAGVDEQTGGDLRRHQEGHGGDARPRR